VDFMQPKPLRALAKQLARQRPLYLTPVRAGFPSPAEDYIEASLDLHTYMVKHPAATFFVRVSGDSMTPGIADGDILVVDKSLTPQPHTVILAVVDGEFTVKRFRRQGGQVILQPDNPTYAPIVITDPGRFLCWGVVTYVVHNPNE
jgi:DNA polymerase V